MTSRPDMDNPSDRLTKRAKARWEKRNTEGAAGRMASTPTKKTSYEEGSLDQYLRDISAYPLISRDEEVRLAVFPNSRLKGEANLLIMPTVDAANIAFNLLKAAAGSGVTLGPMLLGVAKPVHILTPSATVRRIVNMTALTVVDATTQRQPSLL